MRQLLTELMELTKGINISVIEVKNTKHGTAFAAVSDERCMIFQGKSKKRIKGLKDPIGICRLGLLDRVLDERVIGKDAIVSLLPEPKDANEDRQIHVEGDLAFFVPVAKKEAIPNQPKFKGTTWVASIDLKDANVSGLYKAYKLTKRYHNYMTPVCVKDRLKVVFGNPEDRAGYAVVDFAEEPNGAYNGPFIYPMDYSVPVIRHWNTAKMSLSNDGVIVLERSTELIDAMIYFPGHN